MEPVEVLAGLLMLCFVPGYLLYKVLHGRGSGKVMEVFVYSTVYSLAIDVVLGLALGGNETMKALTGGITAANVWIGLVSVSVILLEVVLLRRYFSNRRDGR